MTIYHVNNMGYRTQRFVTVCHHYSLHVPCNNIEISIKHIFIIYHNNMFFPKTRSPFLDRTLSYNLAKSVQTIITHKSVRWF